MRFRLIHTDGGIEMSSIVTDFVVLNNGVNMPRIGLEVFKVDDGKL